MCWKAKARPCCRRDGQGVCRSLQALSHRLDRRRHGGRRLGRWKALTDAVGKTVNLVGDDLFVTNVKRLKQGIDTQTANAILIKVNQIGSLTETLETVEMAHKAAYQGGDEPSLGRDRRSTIADLAVATNCGQIKTGSLARSDRLAKYNQLLGIEEQLGDAAQYAGRSICGLRILMPQLADSVPWAGIDRSRFGRNHQRLPVNQAMPSIECERWFLRGPAARLQTETPVTTPASPPMMWLRRAAPSLYVNDSYVFALT